MMLKDDRDSVVVTASYSEREQGADMMHKPEFYRYESLFDLREKWKQLDDAENALRLTVVLVLAEDFQGHLAGLVRRRHPALRLLISSLSGELPSRSCINELKLRSASLGWHLIGFHHSIEDVLREAGQPLAWGERCVVFCPAEADLAEHDQQSHSDFLLAHFWH